MQNIPNKAELPAHDGSNQPECSGKTGDSTPVSSSAVLGHNERALTEILEDVLAALKGIEYCLHLSTLPPQIKENYEDQIFQAAKHGLLPLTGAAEGKMYVHEFAQRA